VRLPDKESIPRSILRVAFDDGFVIYALHLNSSRLGFCRLEDAMKGARELRDRAKALRLAEDAKAIARAMEQVRSAIGRACSPGIEATKQEALRRARSREAAAGAIALLAAADLKAGKSVFAAGDFNTPLQEACRTGKRLDEDSSR
jgi:hypothetical protein